MGGVCQGVGDWCAWGATLLMSLLLCGTVQFLVAGLRLVLYVFIHTFNTPLHRDPLLNHLFIKRNYHLNEQCSRIDS